MLKNKKPLLILICLCFCFSKTFAETSFWNRFTHTIVEQIDAVVKQNKWNDEHGKSHENQYLIRITNTPDNPLWITDLSKEKLLNTNQLETLNQSILPFNEKFKSARFYIIYVDNFRIPLEKDLNLPPAEAYTALVKNAENNDEAGKIGKQLPAALNNAIGQSQLKNYTDQFVYSTGSVVTQYDNKVKETIYFYTFANKGPMLGNAGARSFINQQISSFPGTGDVYNNPFEHFHVFIPQLSNALTSLLSVNIDDLIASFKTGQAHDFLSLRKKYLVDINLKARILKIAKKIDEDPLVYEGFEEMIKKEGEVLIGNKKFVFHNSDLEPSSASIENIYQAYLAFFDYKKNTINVDQIVEDLKNISSPKQAIELLKKLQDADYNRLTVDQRIYLISLLLSDWFFTEPKENIALKLIEFTPDVDIDNFYSKLIKPSSLSSDPKFKDSSKDPLVQRLCDRTNDSKLFIGADNYKSLLKVFGKALATSNTKRTALNNSQDDKKLFMWDESYFLRLDQAPVGTCSYKINFTENGKLSVTRTIITGYKPVQRTITNKGGTFTYTDYQAQETTQPSLEFDPFDLVVIFNRSELDMLKGEAPKNSFNVVPAVFLYYAADKKYNDNWGRGAMLSADVASLFLGFGEFKAATTILTQGIAIANIILSGTNVAITLSGVDKNPEYKEIIENYQKITAVLGVYQVGSASLQTIKGSAERFIMLVDKYSEAIQIEKSFDKINFLRKFLVNELKIKGAAVLAYVDIKIDVLAAAVKNVKTGGLVYLAVIPPNLLKGTLYAVVYCIKAGKDLTKRTYSAFKNCIKNGEYDLGGLDKDAYKAIDEVVDEKTFNAIAKTQEKLDLSIADEYARLLVQIGDNQKLSLMASSLNLTDLKKALQLYSKLSKELLEDINRLSPETMAILLKDLNDNSKLLEFVEEQPSIMKLWTKHKMEDFDALSDLEKANIDEAYQLALQNESVSTKVEEWAKRSAGYSRLMNNNVKGLTYQSNVTKYYKSLNQLEGVFEQIYLKFVYNGSNPRFKNFIGKSIESIADNILVEKIGNKIRFIYGESKLGKGIITDNQEMLMEMIKTGNFRVEIRSKTGLVKQENIFANQGDRINFEQINIFKGQTITDITQPIIEWNK